MNARIMRSTNFDIEDIFIFRKIFFRLLKYRFFYYYDIAFWNLSFDIIQLNIIAKLTMKNIKNLAAIKSFRPKPLTQ